MRKALGEISDTVRKLRFVPICRMRYRSLLEFQFGGIYPEVIGLPEPIVLGTFYNLLTRTISCRPRLASNRSNGAAPLAAAIMPPTLSSSRRVVPGFGERVLREEGNERWSTISSL